MQFLYKDGADAHFMDTETYEQLDDPREHARRAAALDEGVRRGRGAVHRRRAGRRPAAERDRPRGDRDRARPARRHGLGRRHQAGGARDRRAKIQVPLFVNIGDVVRVDTRSGEYVSRLTWRGGDALRRTEQRRAAVWALYQSDLLGRPLEDTFPATSHAFHARARAARARPPARARRADLASTRPAGRSSGSRRSSARSCVSASSSCSTRRRASRASARSRPRARSTRRSRPPSASAAPTRRGSSTGSSPPCCASRARHRGRR